MSRIRYAAAASLDGFIADDDHSLDWLFVVPHAEEAQRAMAEYIESVEVLIMGASTYDWLVAHEDMMAHPERWQAAHGDRPTFVFSHRARHPVPGANLRFCSGSVADALPEIRSAASGGNIWIVGGGDLAGQFADVGALDEVAVSIAPTTLGGGMPLLPRRLTSPALTLRSAERRGSFVDVVYDVTSPE